jgi:hypothetical protein
VLLKQDKTETENSEYFTSPHQFQEAKLIAKNEGQRIGLQNLKRNSYVGIDPAAEYFNQGVQDKISKIHNPSNIETENLETEKDSPLLEMQQSEEPVKEISPVSSRRQLRNNS